MPVIKTSLTLDPRVKEFIAKRGDNRSGMINRDLERYYVLLSRALKSVPLTVTEASLIVDVLNGTIIDGNTACFLWAEVQDGINLEKLDKKWNIDGDSFVQRLRELNDFQAMALIDAAEIFWQGGLGLPFDEAIKKYFCIPEDSL